jgi:hypothetical protein
MPFYDSLSSAGESQGIFNKKMLDYYLYGFYNEDKETGLYVVLSGL